MLLSCDSRYIWASETRHTKKKESFSQHKKWWCDFFCYPTKPVRVSIRYENVAHFSIPEYWVSYCTSNSFMSWQQIIFPSSNTISVTFKNRINLLWNLTIFYVLLFLAVFSIFCGLNLLNYYCYTTTFHVCKYWTGDCNAPFHCGNHNYGFNGCKGDDDYISNYREFNVTLFRSVNELLWTLEEIKFLFHKQVCKDKLIPDSQVNV